MDAPRCRWGIPQCWLLQWNVDRHSWEPEVIPLLSSSECFSPHSLITYFILCRLKLFWCALLIHIICSDKIERRQGGNSHPTETCGKSPIDFHVSAPQSKDDRRKKWKLGAVHHLCGCLFYHFLQSSLSYVEENGLINEKLTHSLAYPECDYAAERHFKSSFSHTIWEPGSANMHFMIKPNVWLALSFLF